MSTLTADAANHRVADQEIRHKRVFSWTQPWVYLVALVAAAVAIGPVLFVVLGGFRTNIQLLQDPAGLPNPWIFTNYSSILTGEFAARFWGQVLASGVIALSTTALVVLLGVSVAYAIGRFNMRSSGFLFSLFAAGLMFPATIAILPTWIILQNIGLIGNWLGVIIPQVAFALPTTVVILTPFIRAIPKEMEEAASLDGATRTGFFFRILLPLAKPGMVTVGVLAFVGSWNAYMLPLFVLGVGGAPSTQHTLPLGVQMFTTQFSSSMTSIMAFTSLAVIPALIFFLAMEKHIVNGLSGAVKG
ncbi:carbohydrate ABC transporter permease [Xylanimonas sp. McL0601]|uniref:carbohydrate ABC transporter permease n=1 Tax=Xylanimonas sp. McL0601 TaxID=3414739 RepID=UPI003CE9FBBA